MLLKEIKKKLGELTELCRGDEEKEELVKHYAELVVLHETVGDLLKSEHYAKVIADIEESNAKAKDALMTADLQKVSNDLIRQVIADWQANMRIVNTLKGPELEDIGKKLDRSIAALKEEAEMNESI